MKGKTLAIILIPLNIILAYFIYTSISNQVQFNNDAKLRIAENVQKLKDLRQAQIKYKQNKGQFANNFNALINFLENDSIAIVKAIGETPDSLTENEALELEIISRDTSYVKAKESVFDPAYRNSRKNQFPLNINTLTKVPYSDATYNLDAGEVEKGNVIVQVFEISTNYETVFTGLDAKNKSYKLDALLKVGSMTEASLNGNWKSE